MTLHSKSLSAALAVGLSLAALAPAAAEDVYKIGVSAGLTGYAATVDRAWRDGVELAVAALNEKGGVMGRKLEVIVEDNRSEPQEAVTVYRKMLSSDGAQVFISGCVSAGNFAAAGMVARAEVPMMLCSILPKQPNEVEWAFTTLPPAGFEVEKRLEYLRDKTEIRKVGVLHDPTPYANLQNPTPTCRRTSPRRSRPTTASRSSRSRPTSRTTPTSASRSPRCRRPAPARSSRSASAARP